MAKISSSLKFGAVSLYALVVLLPGMDQVAFARGTPSSLATAARNPPVAPPAPPVSVRDCDQESRALMNRLTVDTPLVRNAPIMELNPEQLCAANKDSPMNRRPGANSIEEARVCENTYILAKKSVEDYRVAMLEECQKTNDITKGCENETNRTLCMAKKAKEAADASERAGKLLADAKKQLDELGKSARQAAETFRRDLPKIRSAIEENERAIAAARQAGNGPEVERLERLRREATTVEGGKLSNGAGVWSVLNPEIVAASRAKDVIGGSTSPAPTIELYQNMIPRSGNQSGLQLEQETAARAAQTFSQVVTPEIQSRTKAAADLRAYATNLERIGINQRDPITSSVTPPASSPGISGNTTSASSLPSPATALAAAGPAAALANNMNQQGGASSSSPVNNPMLGSLTSGAEGLGLTSKTLSASSVGGDTARPTRGLENPSGRDPSLPAPADSARLTSVVNRDDSFVSGAGNLPPVIKTASAAGRSVAAAKSGKMSDSNGVDVSLGKKKKDATVAPNCGSDKECINALGLDTLQFNKAGSLGQPVVSAAADSGSIGSLENLFGPLPTEEAAATAAKGDPILGGMNWGASPAGEGYAVESGTQASLVDSTPDNSRTLFSRVRVAHEKALKRGSVSLFHRKL